MPPRSSQSVFKIFSDEKLPPRPSHDMFFDQPSSHASARSPLKVARQPSTSPLKDNPGQNLNHHNVSFLPPHPPRYTDSPTKKPSTYMYPPLVPHKSLKPFFTALQAGSTSEKENVTPNYHSDNLAEFPDPSHGYKAPLKRANPDSTPLQEPRSKKSRLGDSSAPELPEPEDMLVPDDDGRKPPYSYAMLIGMSILRAPDRHLTLAQIYRWISGTFSHYKNKAEPGWQNSIRHNLSLNKAFYKQERPKDDPGKGNYWAIEPGKEMMFINKDKSSRRPKSSCGPNPKSSSQQPSSEANIWITQQIPDPEPIRRALEAQAQNPSSDATILASDAPSSLDDEEEKDLSMPPPASRQPFSSPPQAMNSSPPVLPQSDFNDDTPSPVADFNLNTVSSRPQSRKSQPQPKLPEMDDSGYFSSIGSSATRPYSQPVLPQLDHSKPKIKRGRAEEEIARIRSSSRDVSPSKVRSLKRPTPSLVSSSPLHHLDTTMLLPPLTPAYKFKKPSKPPASISPNTNLRNHRNRMRELVGSPIKNSQLQDGASLSPAFNILEDDQFLMNQGSSPGFTIFQDNLIDNLYRPSASSSPEEGSVRRVGKECASKTGTALAEMVSANINSRTLLSSQQVPMLANFESPLKQKSTKSPLRFGINVDASPEEEFFGVNFFDNDEPDELGGLDILQGFQKIGRSKTPSVSSKKSTRPALGSRSRTSRV